MKRKLFCETSPLAYRLSMEKEILKRHVKDWLKNTHFAKERSTTSLPIVVYRHNSLIRRRLGNVNMQLQENKATNLACQIEVIESATSIQNTYATKQSPVRKGIYTLDGKRIRSTKNTAGLPHGVYYVNGKKTVIR